MSTVLTQLPNESQGRLRGHGLLRLPQILGRVHGQPEPCVAKRVDASLASELRKGRVLVVATLGQTLDGLLAEDVDAAADPVGQLGRLAESRDDVVVAEVDDPERRLERRDGDRRCRARLPVAGKYRAEVEVDQLIAVQREDLSRLLPERGCEAKPSPAAERLGLGSRDDLGAQSSELRDEEILGPGRAADD